MQKNLNIINHNTRMSRNKKKNSKSKQVILVIEWQSGFQQILLYALVLVVTMLWNCTQHKSFIVAKYMYNNNNKSSYVDLAWIWLT